ncbi:hypothetical protein BaRGS_00009278 [Batillaria attramentaria]|uniref:Uncharacterized protein n=1 Tax=Batillaria attramentaria TaxID=370345 RepID=A0ABD0LK11_9CAEN
MPSLSGAKGQKWHDRNVYAGGCRQNGQSIWCERLRRHDTGTDVYAGGCSTQVVKDAKCPVPLMRNALGGMTKAEMCTHAAAVHMWCEMQHT